METAFGVVLDLSLAHEVDGKRRLDNVKKQLVQFIREAVADVEDSLYLYHADLVDTMIKNGDQVSAVSNYETDGWKFNISNALKQTLYVIAAEDDDYRKILILVTDRIDNTTPLKKAMRLNEVNGYEVKFLVVGIGGRYNKDEVGQLAEQDGTLAHLYCENGLFLCSAIKEALQYGTEPYIPSANS